MKKFIIPALAAMMVGAVAAPSMARAEEAAPTTAPTTDAKSPEDSKDQSKWLTTLKDQHHLTDEQIKAMKDKGIAYPQMAMVATLSEKSGKSIDDILKMRTEQKMGWGKIAKELGVPPKELGHSVAEMRHEMHEEKRAERDEKKEEKRQERLDRKEAKREERANKHK
jgi:hypothetical protein